MESEKKKFKEKDNKYYIPDYSSTGGSAVSYTFSSKTITVSENVKHTKVVVLSSNL